MPRLARIGLPALALVAALAAWGWTRRGAKPSPPAAPPSPAVDPVAEERDLLRDEVRRLGLEVATMRAEQRRNAAAVAAAAATTADPPPERPSPEMEARWLMARASMLDEALAAQPRDDRWADALEVRARSLYASRANAGVKLVGAACRSTACRFEFSYTDGDARMTHIQGLGQDFGELPRVSYAYPGEPENHTRAIMFLAQQDHPLPQLDYAKFAATP